MIDVNIILAVIGTVITAITAFLAIRREWNKKRRELIKKGMDKFSDEAKKFVVKSEELLTYPEEVRENTLKIWESARNYVKMASLTALPELPWAPSEDILQKKKNVKIKIILLHPEAIDFLAKLEATFSEGPEFVNLSPEIVKTDFIKQLKESVPKLTSIIGEDNIRFYKKPFYWKGTIVDGKYAQYVFYDIPRKSVPFRYTEDKNIIEYFEQNYFDEIWDNSTPLEEMRDLLDNLTTARTQYVVLCALIRKEDKMLLTYKIKSSNPLTVNVWEIPGGRAPFGMSYEDGVKVKVKEYLGVDVEIVRTYPKIFSNVIENEKYIKHYFVICAECKIVNGKIKLNKDKLSQWKWFTFEESEKLHEQRKLASGDFEFIKIAFEKP